MKDNFTFEPRMQERNDGKKSSSKSNEWVVTLSHTHTRTHERITSVFEMANIQSKCHY